MLKSKYIAQASNFNFLLKEISVCDSHSGSGLKSVVKSILLDRAIDIYINVRIMGVRVKYWECH